MISLLIPVGKLPPGRAGPGVSDKPRKGAGFYIVRIINVCQPDRGVSE